MQSPEFKTPLPQKRKKKEKVKKTLEEGKTSHVHGLTELILLK
jgi:hypothetical protein